ncbi:T9SS type A sorting domain-containing protein [Aureispira anguillae]|uniref:T9SS type A sorting domain-containing protein n=1 Tax=Aureispira anguillae TaxID=2864201 RepID=A0A915YK40_9BACT|nr:T9SS type A sorting domain-containing protein [Aureispira anguillae]BDS14535.1 T9SS type A sorting domain-containing protein [Aureispira anguillae]
MIRSNLMFVCALALASLYSIGANAQTKVWGAGASAGQADGEFQNAFTQTGTAGSYSATTWTALSVFENQSATTSTVNPGAAYWTRSTLGYSQGYYAGNTPMPSPTRTNGVAIFDSGFMDNNGTSAQGTGTSPAGHRGELISPRIDLSGYTDSALVVQFFSEFRDHDITELSVSMSTDDGLTWSTPSDYQILQGSSDPKLIRVLLSNVTAGVANLSQSRVRFTFEGNYYYAMIDDVTIETAPEYDIAWGLPDPNSNLISGSGDFAKIGGNRYQALSNLDPTNTKEWFWGGKVINYGAKTLYPQDSARIYVAIDYYDEVTNAPTFDVYLDTMNIDTLEAGDQVGTPFIEYLRDISFIQNKKGNYRVRYWLTHNKIDGNAANDTVRHTFTITGSGTSYISKARRAASDLRVFASRGMFPANASGVFSAFEYGSVYYFPKGMTNNLRIDSIDFRYQVPNGYTGNASQTVFVNVYKLTDGSGASPSDGLLDSDELLHIGVGTANLTGLGTTVAGGDFALGTVSSLVDPSSGGAMPNLADHGFYYVSVLQNPAVLGGAATFTATTALWIGSDQYNYYMNRLMSRADTVINPSPSMNTDAAGSVSWFADGFGGGYVPSIGIHMPPVYNSTTPIIATNEAAEMSAYPNPTNTILNVEVKFEEATNVQYIMTDVSGRVIFIADSDNVTEETQTFNVEQFPAGVYFITAKTDKGATTQRIIKK